jgi:hypothetical protein
VSSWSTLFRISSCLHDKPDQLLPGVRRTPPRDIGGTKKSPGGGRGFQGHAARGNQRQPAVPVRRGSPLRAGAPERTLGVRDAGARRLSKDGRLRVEARTCGSIPAMTLVTMGCPVKRSMLFT